MTSNQTVGVHDIKPHFWHPWCQVKPLTLHHHTKVMTTATFTEMLTTGTHGTKSKYWFWFQEIGIKRICESVLHHAVRHTPMMLSLTAKASH